MRVKILREVRCKISLLLHFLALRLKTVPKELPTEIRKEVLKEVLKELMIKRLLSVCYNGFKVEFLLP